MTRNRSNWAIWNGRQSIQTSIRPCLHNGTRLGGRYPQPRANLACAPSPHFALPEGRDLTWQIARRVAVLSTHLQVLEKDPDFCSSQFLQSKGSIRNLQPREHHPRQEVRVCLSSGLR